MTEFKKIPIKSNGDNFFKRSISRRILRGVVITIVVLGALLVLAGSIASYYAQKKAEIEFRKVNGTFSSLKINLFSRSVTVNDILWESPADSTQNKASINFIRLQGISLLQLLFNKQLHANTLQIDSGAITFHTLRKKDSVQTSSNKSFPFEIENIILSNIFVTLKQDSITQIDALLNLRYGSVKVDSLNTFQASLKSV